MQLNVRLCMTTDDDDKTEKGKKKQNMRINVEFL